MPWMTVAENLLLRYEPRGRTRLIRRRELVSRADDHFARLGIQGIDPSELPAALSLAQRQVIEIARALLRDPAILFLDEPTSALAEQEVAWLFRLVRDLRDRGKAVIFTSHRWSEVADLADRITIFRNGEHVATREHLTEGEAVTLMTGRTIDRMYPDRRPLSADAETVLEVRDLQGAQASGISFAVRKGEILGIGGLAGQGQHDLFMTLFGARKASGGEILDRRQGPADPEAGRRDPAGNGHRARPRGPQDRGADAADVGARQPDARDPRTASPPPASSTPRPSARTCGVPCSVSRSSTSRPTVQAVGTLSGGNQQKVLLGRWLLAESNILLLYDITRGVDVGTKHDIYELMMELVGEGKSLIFYSSETEEIARLCHRVLVMREGRVAAELEGESADAEAIVAAAVRENAA